MAGLYACRAANTNARTQQNHRFHTSLNAPITYEARSSPEAWPDSGSPNARISTSSASRVKGSLSDSNRGVCITTSVTLARMERGVADTVVDRRVGVTVAMGDFQANALPAGMSPAIFDTCMRFLLIHFELTVAHAKTALLSLT